MKPRLNQLIEKQLGNSKLSSNLKKNIAKTGNAIYDRMFDSLNVLDDETCSALVEKMRPIVNAFVVGFVKEVKGCHLIVRHEASNFLDIVARVERIYHYLLQEMEAFVDNQIINESGAIRPHIKAIAEKLIDKAIVQILDGRGNLRWELVQQLGLNDALEKSKAVRDPNVIAMVVSGYFSGAVAQLAEKLTASEDPRERSLVGHVQGLEALKKGLRALGSVAAIKEKINATQKVDREHEFASGFVTELLAMCSIEFAAYKETLVMLVQADFDKFHDNAYLQKPENKKLADHMRIKKLSFWLDVMFQLVINKNYAIFSAVFEVFQGNLRVEMDVEEKSEKGQKGFDHQLLDKHPEKLDRYSICLHEKDEYEDSLGESKESDDEEEMWVDVSPERDQNPVVAKLQRFLDAHDCYLAIDLVVQSYVHPGKFPIDQRPSEEFELLNKWIKISQSDAIFTCGEAVRLLNDAYQSFCSNRHSVASAELPKAGMLEEILSSGKAAFSGHLLTDKTDSLKRIKSISAAMQLSSSSLSSLDSCSVSDDDEQKVVSVSESRSPTSSVVDVSNSPRASTSTSSNVVPSAPVRVLFNQAVDVVKTAAGESVQVGVKNAFTRGGVR